MAKPPYLFPFLVVATVIHALETIMGILGSFLMTAGFSLLFRDAPDMRLGFPWSMALLLIVLTTVLPLVATVAQWVFYARSWFKTSFVIALLGLLPSMEMLLRLLRH